MKRIFLAIGIGFALVFGYLAVSSVVVLMMSKDPAHLDMDLVSMVDIPMRLPKYVYYYFYPPTAEDYSAHFNMRRTFAAVLIFASNVLLYSIPPYLVILATARTRKPNTELLEVPPPPAF